MQEVISLNDKEAAQPDKSYRRHKVHKFVANKLIKEHGLQIRVIFPDPAVGRWDLSEGSLEEFIWILRSREAEENIDVWVDGLKKKRVALKSLLKEMIENGEA